MMGGFFEVECGCGYGKVTSDYFVHEYEWYEKLERSRKIKSNLRRYDLKPRIFFKH